MDAAKIRGHDAFISKGFDCWKHALSTDRGFTKHEVSDLAYIRHVQNCLPIDSVNWTIQTAAHPSIAGSLSAAFHEHQLQREKTANTGRLTAIMQFLMRLGLAFRGYRESEDSLHRGKYILAGGYRTA